MSLGKKPIAKTSPTDPDAATSPRPPCSATSAQRQPAVPHPRLSLPDGAQCRRARLSAGQSRLRQGGPQRKPACWGPPRIALGWSVTKRQSSSDKHAAINLLVSWLEDRRADVGNSSNSLIS